MTIVLFLDLAQKGRLGLSSIACSICNTSIAYGSGDKAVVSQGKASSCN